MEEDIEVADAEMDVREAPPTGVLAPEQAPVPAETMLAMAGIWVDVQGGQVAKPVVSSRARGRRLPNRQSSRPQLRQMKSWLAGSRWRNRWRRKPAKEEMWPPWRWLWKLLGH